MVHNYKNRFNEGKIHNPLVYLNPFKTLYYSGPAAPLIILFIVYLIYLLKMLWNELKDLRDKKNELFGIPSEDKIEVLNDYQRSLTQNDLNWSNKESEYFK